MDINDRLFVYIEHASGNQKLIRCSLRTLARYILNNRRFHLLNDIGASVIYMRPDILQRETDKLAHELQQKISSTNLPQKGNLLIEIQLE